MPVDRLLPSEEAADLIALARDIADKVLTPIVDAHEKAESYPEGVFAQLGAAGLLSPAAARAVGWGRAAVRGVPAGAGGARGPLGRNRGGGQRAQPVVTPAAGVRPRDYRVERYMREAKIMQIFEGRR